MDLNDTNLTVTISSSVEGLTCSGADDHQLNWYVSFAWWLEGFIQLVTGNLHFCVLEQGWSIHAFRQAVPGSNPSTCIVFIYNSDSEKLAYTKI